VKAQYRKSYETQARLSVDHEYTEGDSHKWHGPTIWLCKPWSSATIASSVVTDGDVVKATLRPANDSGPYAGHSLSRQIKTWVSVDGLAFDQLVHCVDPWGGYTVNLA